ncbi:MAG: hypothetical protein ACUVUC_05870 [Thermoguttaceae bacterium]
MRYLSVAAAAWWMALAGALAEIPARGAEPGRQQYTVYPIGWIRKSEGKTTIVLDKQY